MDKGLFGRLQERLDARDGEEVISPAGWLDLPAPPRKLLTQMARQKAMSIRQAATALGQNEEQAAQVLAALVAQGFLTETQAGGEKRYKVQFARKRGREMLLDIWEALSGKFPRGEV